MTARREPSATAAFAGSRERFETVLGWLEGEEAGTSSTPSWRRTSRRTPASCSAGSTRTTWIYAPNGSRGSRRWSTPRGWAAAAPSPATRVGSRPCSGRSGWPGSPTGHAGSRTCTRPTGRSTFPTRGTPTGLRRLAAIEASRGSFDGAVEAIERGTGQRVGKRQVEELAQRTATDLDAFYSGRQPPAGSTGDVLVLSCDGKGVVMRPAGLRAATAASAAKTSPKLATRLSKGEKRNRKRMAEVGTVYDATPAPRTPADILPATEEDAATPWPDR